MRSAKSPTARSVIRAAGSSAALKLYAVGAAFLTSLLLARHLGAGGYGAYAFATSAVALISVPSGLGLDRLAVKLTAAYQARGEWPLFGSFLRASNRLTLVASLGLTALVAGLTQAGLFRLDAETSGALLLCLLMVPVLALTSLRQAVLRGLHHVAAGQVPELLVRPTLLLLGIGVLALLRPAWLTPSAAMLMTVVTAMLAYLFGAWVLQRKLKATPVSYASASYPQTKSWLGEALPFVTLGLITVANNRAEILMLGALSSSSELGIFHVASRLSDLCAMVLYAINTAAAPHYSRLLALDRLDELRRNARKVAWFVFVATIPIVVVYAFFRRDILGIFGPEFVAGAPALVVLSLAQLFNAATGSVGTVLNMSGKASVTSIGIITGLTVNVALGVILVPEHGALGAALAGAAGIVVWNALLLYFCISRVGVNPSIFPFPVNRC